MDAQVSRLEEENSSLKNEIAKLRALLQAQKISAATKPTIEYTSDDGGHPETMPFASLPSRECANGDDSEDGVSHFYYSAGETELGPLGERGFSEDDIHNGNDGSRLDRPYHSEDDQHHLHTQSDEEHHPPKDVLVAGLRLVPLFNAHDQCMEIVAQVVDDISVTA